jgi:hypothetical protein
MGKNGGNLYEILRSATNGGTRPSASYPAPKPTSSAPAPAVEPAPETPADGGIATLTPPPAPAIVIAPPNVEAIVRPAETAKQPTPMPHRLRVEPTRPRIMLTPPLAGAAAAPAAPQPLSASRLEAPPGERTLRLTYNTAGFAALIVLGLCFAAYSIGLRGGRPAAPSTAAVLPADPGDPVTPPANPPAAPPPVVTPKVYSIRLMEWPAATDKERVMAKNNALNMKNALDKLGYRDGRVMENGTSLFLFYGSYDSRTSDAARAALDAFKKTIKLGKDTTPTFAKAAGIVEVK